MKNSKATSISIINVIRAIVMITIFFSPNIVRAFEIENPTISYGPICETAWEYDSYVKFSGEKSIEVVNDIDSWIYNKTEELCNSSCEPVRVLGEYFKESNDDVRPSARQVAVGFTKFIVNQCHDIVDTWFTKG